MSDKRGSVELGAKIKARRLELGMTRYEAAEKTGLSYPYISQIETGYRNASYASMSKLAKALKVSLDDFSPVKEKSHAFEEAQAAWIDWHMDKWSKGERVIVGTRNGLVPGNIVSVTPSGNVCVQLDGYSDVIYRNPRHLKLQSDSHATTTRQGPGL